MPVLSSAGSSTSMSGIQLRMVGMASINWARRDSSIMEPSGFSFVIFWRGKNSFLREIVREIGCGNREIGDSDEWR